MSRLPVFFALRRNQRLACNKHPAISYKNPAVAGFFMAYRLTLCAVDEQFD